MSNCVAVACATERCQATIHVHHDVLERLKRTGETFYCTAGHHNYYPVGSSDEQKKIARLERSVERWQELYGDMLDERDDWKLQAKRCPFECGFRVLRKSSPRSIEWALQAHLIEEHGAELERTSDLVEVELEA